MPTLILVQCYLNLNGFNEKTHILEVKETSSCYTYENRRINKNKLNVIQTKFLENYKSLNYYMYCLEGQEKESSKTLKDHISKKIKVYKKEIDILFKFLD